MCIHYCKGLGRWKDANGEEMAEAEFPGGHEIDITKAEYEEYFGENISDETITVTVNITSKAFQTLKKEKELTGNTYGEIISYALGLM